MQKRKCRCGSKHFWLIFNYCAQGFPSYLDSLARACGSEMLVYLVDDVRGMNVVWMRDFVKCSGNLVFLNRRQESERDTTKKYVFQLLQTGRDRKWVENWQERTFDEAWREHTVGFVKTETKTRRKVVHTHRMHTAFDGGCKNPWEVYMKSSKSALFRRGCLPDSQQGEAPRATRKTCLRHCSGQHSWDVACSGVFFFMADTRIIKAVVLGLTCKYCCGFGSGGRRWTSRDIFGPDQDIHRCFSALSTFMLLLCICWRRRMSCKKILGAPQMRSSLVGT